MEALLAPVAAAGGTAAGAGAAIGGAATSAALLADAAAPLLGGLAAFSEAKGQKKAAEINSYIGRTRALQTDASARSGLEGELATMRATFASNQQRPGVGTFEIMKELRKTRDKERAVAFGNRMQEAADYRLAGKNAMTRGALGMFGGYLTSAPLFARYNEFQKKRPRVGSL